MKPEHYTLEFLDTIMFTWKFWSGVESHLPSNGNFRDLFGIRIKAAPTLQMLSKRRVTRSGARTQLFAQTHCLTSLSWSRRMPPPMEQKWKIFWRNWLGMNLGRVITPEIAFVVPITPPLLNVISSAPMQMLARMEHVSVWLDTLRTGQKAWTISIPSIRKNKLYKQ